MSVTLRSKIQDLRVPIFLRKLDRRSDWGDVSDPFASRVTHAAKQAFHCPDNCFSLYKVSCDLDFSAVVIGLNSVRTPQNQQIDFVPFLEEEITSSGIRMIITPGTTKCRMANRLHVDAHFEQQESILQLCRVAMSTNRCSFRVVKRESSLVVCSMTEYGCGAVVQPPACHC